MLFNNFVGKIGCQLAAYFFFFKRVKQDSFLVIKMKFSSDTKITLCCVEVVMGTVFKNQSPACMYCILCRFSKDRDILTILVTLIGRPDFYCVDVSPQLIALPFNDPLGEASSVASTHEQVQVYITTFCAKKLERKHRLREHSR